MRSTAEWLPTPLDPTRPDLVWVAEEIMRLPHSPRPDDGLRHRDGVPWWDAPVPRRLHRCRPQTRGKAGGELVERCACGAIRIERFGPGWSERNSRKMER